MRLKTSLYLGGAAVVLVAAGLYVSKFQKAPQLPGVETVALAAPAGITFQGTRYADGAGLTLYTSDKDTETGKSNCNADCAKTWKAVIAPANAKPSGSWSLASRPDGAVQWAFKGKPVYTSASDEKVGDVKGNGAESGAWHVAEIDITDGVVTPVGLAVREVAVAPGHALVDDRGMTVYAFDGDLKRDKPPSAADWAPMTAAAIANPVGNFSLVTAGDGNQQWAYKGKALYTYAHDVTPGDAKGLGLDARLHVALVARYFMPPAVVVRSNPGAGAILATTAGIPLYMHDGFRYQVGNHYTREGSRGVPAIGRQIGLKGCDAACLQTWHPFTAAPDAQPSGHWTILARDNGTRQWAYQGYAVYTYTGDKNPGDMTGNDIYDYQISQDLRKVADASIPISLNWHVVFP